MNRIIEVNGKSYQRLPEIDKLHPCKGCDLMVTDDGDFDGDCDISTKWLIEGLNDWKNQCHVLNCIYKEVQNEPTTPGSDYDVDKLPGEADNS